jgi:hypothetical protein
VCHSSTLSITTVSSVYCHAVTLGDAAGVEATASTRSPAFKVAQHEDADAPASTNGGVQTAEGRIYTEGSITVVNQPLVIPALVQAAQRERVMAAAGGREPNFKAFRHKADAGACMQHGTTMPMRMDLYVAPAAEDAQEEAFLR